MNLIEMSQQQARAKLAQAEEQQASQEFRGLVVEYCALGLAWEELEQVEWTALARRLGTRADWLAEAARAMDSQKPLWEEVLRMRVKKVGASRVFRDGKWERLENLALDKLMSLTERGLVKDPGELLAIASAARRAIPSGTPQQQQPGGTTVNVNFGVPGQDSDGLPAAGAKMSIDLSPRTAQALEERRAQVRPKGERVIDGEMLSAKDLRAILSGETASEAEIEKEIEG